MLLDAVHATFKARLAILRGRVQAGHSGRGLDMAIDAFADEYDAFVEGLPAIP